MPSPEQVRRVGSRIAILNIVIIAIAVLVFAVSDSSVVRAICVIFAVVNLLALVRVLLTVRRHGGSSATN